MANIVIARYWVTPGNEPAFVQLLAAHGPTLRRLGLATSFPTQVYRGAEKDGTPYFVEIFEWRDEEAVRIAHEHPEVAAVWERMGPLVAERDGQKRWEFPHVDPVDVQGG